MLKFLYESVFGRALLKILKQPVFSVVVGWVMKTDLSRLFIGGYIRQNQIDMSRFEERKFHSFNDFFTRSLKNEEVSWKSPRQYLSAPCDGKVSAYNISNKKGFSIKNSKYTVTDLIGDKLLAEEYNNGVCLIFRLEPDDYHRYHYIDDGEIVFQKTIKGCLHTIRPIAQSYYPVFLQNTRECTAMDTSNFGPILQIEVGALLVGKIRNHKASGTFKFSEEKGYFEFGGSTIILLLKEDVVKIREDILKATIRGEEIDVQVGDVIGERC